MRSGQFHKGWEPTLIEEQILAEGTWWYDGTVPYNIVLKRERFDYSAADLERLETILDPINVDYLDFAINGDGDIFVWCFEGPEGAFRSKSLSTLSEAKEHLGTYGRVQIRWRPAAT